MTYSQKDGLGPLFDLQSPQNKIRLLVPILCIVYSCQILYTSVLTNRCTHCREA